MPAKKTTEEYKNEVETITNGEYTILSEYKTASDKVLFKHLACGREYYATPKNFTRGRRCSHCNNVNKPKTTEEFAKEVIERSNGEYELVSEYGMNNKTHVTILHKVCNNTFEIAPYNFICGHRCPYCFKKKLKTTEEFKEEMKSLVGDEYTLLEDYVNNDTKVLFMHNKCKRRYIATPNKFIQGRRCPHCNMERLSQFALSRAKTTEEFNKEVREITNNEYYVIGDYINQKTKIELYHKICKKSYFVKPSEFLIKGTRCPYCNESKGENRIRIYLDKHNIKYDKEYEYPDLYDKDPSSPLRFDFFLEDYNLLIEYDGRQHFEKAWYDTEEEFQDRVRRDRMKNKYCEDNNINLLRIKYTNLKNIENIIKKELKFND